MAEAKRAEYVPADFASASALVRRVYGEEVFGELSNGETLILCEMFRLHKRIDEIESQAQDMMSPEKMMELAGNFLGSGFTG